MTDDSDDPLLRPASDAGWDDAPAKPTPLDAKPTPLDAKPTPLDAKPTPLDAKPTPLDAKPTPLDAKPSPLGPTTTTLDAKATPLPAKPTTADASGDKPAAAADEPLLPATYDENALRAAVGASPLAAPATPRKRHAAVEADDDEPTTPRNRKAILITVLSVAAGLGIAALILLGRLNSDRYLLACEAERAVPQQGRGFPPWGVHALDGEPWRPLKITAETRCQPHETEDLVTLQRLYLAMILDQTTAILSAREVTRVDDADALLKQALLLTRPPEHESDSQATERAERHKDVERMLGDVTYWRATARLRDAGAALADAAKQFERAAAQHPRHVSDASAWASYIRSLGQQLRTGPGGPAGHPAPIPGVPTPVPPAAIADPSTAADTAPTPADAEHVAAPPGIALPVEPDKPITPARPAAPPAAPAPRPTGGVLL